MGSVYQEVMTSNLSAGGVQNDTPYTNNEYILQTITVPNADKVKVVVDYGTTGGTGYLTIAEGTVCTECGTCGYTDYQCILIGFAAFASDEQE